MSLSYLIYNFILYSALVCAVVFSPVIAILLYRSGKYRASLLKRLGITVDETPGIKKGDPVIWLHAVSVGETLATINFQKKIKEAFANHKLLFTVSTEAGFALAREKCRAADAVLYFPMDFHFCIRRFISRFNIKALILTETEVWPNLLYAVKKTGAPIFIINGRISDRSFKNYLRFSYILRPFFALIDRCLMQSRLDVERVTHIGAKPENVFMCGNIKYDEIKAYFSIDKTSVYSKFGYSDKDLIFVAGSVHPGEDKMVVDAYLEVKKSHPDLKMIIAPRKFDKLALLFEYLTSRGIEYEKRSVLIKNDAHRLLDVMVLDTVGELVLAYSMARAVFVGGSLINVGGHNLLEAAVFNKPVIFGPYMHNFREMSEGFVESGAARVVCNVEELAQRLSELLKMDETEYNSISKKSFSEVTRRTGASEKNIFHLQSLINSVIIMLISCIMHI